MPVFFIDIFLDLFACWGGGKRQGILRVLVAGHAPALLLRGGGGWHHGVEAPSPCKDPRELGGWVYPFNRCQQTGSPGLDPIQKKWGRPGTGSGAGSCLFFLWRVFNMLCDVFKEVGRVDQSACSVRVVFGHV